MEVPLTTTLLRETPLVRALHSAIRNKDSSRRTFVTSADRLVQASSQRTDSSRRMRSPPGGAYPNPNAQPNPNPHRRAQMLLEEALGLLPVTPVTIRTPCGSYEGVALPEESTIVAVSIMRAADCMLGVCRAMLPASAVGKILIQRDEATAEPALPLPAPTPTPDPDPDPDPNPTPNPDPNPNPNPIPIPNPNLTLTRRRPGQP